MTSAERTRPQRPVPASRLRRATAGLLTRLPLAAAVRGAVALALPLFVGVSTGWVTPAVIAAIGALWGVSQDGADPYRLRVRRLVGLGSAAALGLLAGELALRSGQATAVTVCLAAAAFASGLVSPLGRVASVAGMHLLLGATIGSGIPVPGPWWRPPLALLAGVALVLVLTATPWLWRRHHIERAAVLAVYRAASEALTAAGTPGAEGARRRLTDALSTAQEVMGRHLLRGEEVREPQLRRLIAAFHLAVRLSESVTTLVWEARPLSPTAVNVPMLLAERVLPGRKQTAVPALPELAPETPGLRALADLCAAVGHEQVDEAVMQLPNRPRAGWTALLRYATLLTVCVLVAQLCAHLLDGPRGYWLPMTVAFVYKPDFGPLFRRAVHRCVGTVVGVAAIGVMSLLTDDNHVVIGAVAAFGALMAVGVRHHYALATLALTAVVFVLLDLLGDHRALYWPRILDTALAAAIVLVAHFAVWPDSATGRADAQTEAALAEALRYRDLAPAAGPAQRDALRRTAYHQLAEARRAAAHARREPSRPGRRLPDWEEAITTAERLCDAVTARSVTAPQRS
jgi:uncharacterized membrane protein YccC